MADTSGGFLDAIVEWSIDLMSDIGPIGAAVAVFLDNVFPPIPSEVVLPLAGMAASRGSFSLVEALAWATAGSLVSALVLYGLAAWLGTPRLRRIVDRLPLMSAADVDKATEWFHRHGRKAVFFGRMVPGVRSLISLPAGVVRMHVLWFCVLTSLGSLLWNAIFILAGFFLGEAWPLIQPYTRILEIVAVVAILGLLAWFLTVRIRGRIRARRSVAAAE